MKTKGKKLYEIYHMCFVVWRVYLNSFRHLTVLPFTRVFFVTNLCDITELELDRIRTFINNLTGATCEVVYVYLFEAHVIIFNFLVIYNAFFRLLFVFSNFSFLAKALSTYFRHTSWNTSLISSACIIENRSLKFPTNPF